MSFIDNSLQSLIQSKLGANIERQEVVDSVYRLLDPQFKELIAKTYIDRLVGQELRDQNTAQGS